MKEMTVIKIAKQFSEEPAGRFPTDGQHSGERFREELLIPALREAKRVILDLDGAEGYGSSFLEEAFGGLVRLAGFESADLLMRLEFVSNEDPSLEAEIKEYISEAVPAST